MERVEIHPLVLRMYVSFNFITHYTFFEVVCLQQCELTASTCGIMDESPASYTAGEKPNMEEHMPHASTYTDIYNGPGYSTGESIMIGAAAGAATVRQGWE